MICYQDKTFCISENCKNKCGRQLTQEIKDGARDAGLPIAVASFCVKTEPTVNELLSELTGFPNLWG